jgi:hypothetical protein
MFRLEAGLAFDEFVEMQDESGEPMDRDVARVFAVMAGGVNAGIEYFQLDKLLDSVPGGKALMGRFTREGLKKAMRTPSVRRSVAGLVKRYAGVLTFETLTEIAQEAVTIVAGEAAKGVSDKDFESVSVAEAGERLAETGLKAAQSFSLMLIPGNVARGTRDVVRARRAKTTQERMDKLSEQVASSRLAERSPDRLEQFVREAAPEDGKAVYIDARALTTFFQENPAERMPLAQDLELDAHEVAEAAATGARVRVPVEKVARHVMGTQSYEALRDDMALSALEMTPREAQQVDPQQELERLEYEEKARRKTDVKPEQARALEKQLADELGYAQEDAEAVVAPLVAYARHAAPAWGMTPEEWFEARAIKFAKDRGGMKAVRFAEGEDASRVSRQSWPPAGDTTAASCNRHPQSREAEDEGVLGAGGSPARTQAPHESGDVAQAWPSDKNVSLGTRGSNEAGAPFSRAELEAELARLAERAPRAMPVRVVDTFADLPAHVKAEAERQGVGGVRAVMDERTGLMWAVADSIHDRDEAVRLWRHEQGLHHGLRGLFGERYGADAQQEIDAFLDSVAETLGGQENAASPEFRRIAAEESLASIAERIDDGMKVSDVERTVWQRFVDIVRRLVGAERALSEQEILKIILGAREWVKSEQATLRTFNQPMNRAVEVVGNELGEGLNQKELRAAARKFYADELVGKVKAVEHPELGEIQFRSSGRKKCISFSADVRKLQIIPFLPELLRSAQVLGREEVQKPRGWNVRAYYRMKAQVRIEGKMQEVRFVIREDDKGRMHYDHYFPVGKEASTVSPGVSLKEGRTVPADAEDSYEQSIGSSSDGVNLEFHPVDATPRGSVTFGPAETLVKVFEGGDLSTVLHECGHIFLEDMKDLVQSGMAPAALQEDWYVVRDWLGLKEGQKITRTQHEQFARGFEAYLMEGKAPSLVLRGAFLRFRRWLIAVYRSISTLNVSLSPEMSRVFDRMLATEEEIREVREFNRQRSRGIRAHAGRGVAGGGRGHAETP